MKSKRSATDRLALTGLTLAPPQLWGNVRLVPILRDHVQEDLRLSRRPYHADVTQAADSKFAYLSYVPHGLVVSFSETGAPVAAFGAQIHGKDGRAVHSCCATLQMLHRMVKREDRDRVRLLPLHLSMEGFLGLHFGGPDIAWSEYSQQATSRGLGVRMETSLPGSDVPGLEDALRVFEIHDHQVGLLLFVSGALASAFVSSHPEDYRALHSSLLQDFYGEILYYYGIHGTDEASPLEMRVDEISTLADIRRGLEGMRDQWEQIHREMSAGILTRGVDVESIYRFGPFRLQRFATDLTLHNENHIGERIVRDDGTLEYLKTFRLSDAQCRRAYLLRVLSEHHWNLEATARAARSSRDELVLRLEKAGFGYLLKDHVLAEARRRAQKRKRRRDPS